jgi:lipopolysaccharide assembly outer membrane protein LptD (OstA)
MYSLYKGIKHCSQYLILFLVMYACMPLQIYAAAAPKPDTLSPAKNVVPTDSLAGKKKKPDAAGLTDTVYYSTDGGYIDYDIDSKKMHLIKNAAIRYQKMTLFADSIIYNTETGILTATGKPELIEGNDTTIGESMVYNMKTRRGRVSYASTHMDEAYFNGQRIVKADNNILYVEQGDYTTCSHPDTPDYYFTGKNIKLIQDNKIIGKPVIFTVADAPIAWLPFFMFPVQKNRKSGFLTPSWGGHPESGGYIDNLGYYWVPNDYVDLKTSARIQDFQQFVFNAASNYKIKYLLSGSVAGRYAYNSDFAAKSQQWSLDYTHNQNITPDGSFTLAGRGNLVSDKSFYKSFSEDSSELLNQTISANLALTKRFESINASASLSFNRTMNLKTGETTDEFPAVAFSLPSRPLFPVSSEQSSGSSDKNNEVSWYHNISWSYAINGLQKSHTEEIDTANYKTAAVSQSVNLSAPIKLFKWITVNPNFSAQLSSFDTYMDTAARDSVTIQDTTFDTITTIKNITRPIADTVTSYNRITGETDTSYRVVDSISTRNVPRYATHHAWANDFSWNMGMSMSTNIYGVYPLHLFNFVGIRQTITPNLSYTYTPQHNLDKRFYSIVSYESAHKESQTLNFSIANQFQGKMETPSKTPGEKPTEKKFQILSLSLSSGYNFMADTRKWQNLSVNASTSYSVFRVTYNSQYWMYDANDKLSLPLLNSYSVSVSPNALTAQGGLWDGDKLSLKYGNTPSNSADNKQTWQVSINPSYSFSQSRSSANDEFTTTKNYSLNSSASLNFTKKWSVSWSSYYNFQTNQMVGNNFNFACDLECWDMHFSWQPSGSYNAGYSFKVNIKKIPEIFWEKKD